jgi:hypothetical protein
MRLKAVGSQLTAYIENVPVLTATDTDFATGSFGFVGIVAPNDFDELLANPVCAGPTPTVTPTLTVTSTYTVTPTPPFQKSNFGDLVLGPVPAAAGSTLCLYFAQEPKSSAWEVFNSAGERVAHLDFSGSLGHCWDTKGMSPGIYFAKLSAEWAAGGSATATRKIVLVK